MEKLGLLGNAIIYRIFGFIFLTVSLIFFVKPKAMIKLDAQGRRIAWCTHWTLRYRIISGLFFLIISLVMLRSGFLLIGGRFARLGLLGNSLFYFVSGGILFFAAIGYFFAPKVMKKVDRLGSRSLGTTPIMYGLHPYVMGMFFLTAGLLLLWAGFFIL